MRLMFLAVALVSTCGMFAVPARAQEAKSFTGPRVEATVGWDRIQSDAPVAGAKDHLEAARVGLAAGYDVALGQTFTIGAEAGVGFDLGHGTRETVGASSYRLDTGRDIDLSLRLGARVSPSTLIYAKAGYANSRFEAKATTGTATVKEHTTEDGLRVGAGVEHMIGDHLYAKGEYRYTSYGHGVNRHQALVGVGYRF